MTVTLETIESDGTPVFKSRKRAIVKGKDIRNRAAKSWKVTKKTASTTCTGEESKTETIQETLGEVFATPTPAVTHKTSLYKQFRKEKAALCQDTRDPYYGDKGIGKGGT